MGYKDTDKVVGQAKGDLPIQHHFATFSREGKVIEEADLIDTDILRMYETMQFDEGRSQTGQIVGSIATSMATANKALKLAQRVAPKHPAVQVGLFVGGQMTSAFVGGSVGDLTQSILTKDVKKHGWAVAFDSAFDAGNEEAMYELLGLSVVGGVVKGAKWAAGKPYMNIQWIRDQIAKAGGNLTASQVVDGWMLETAEGLAEVSWAGRKISEARTLNEAAINKYVLEYVNNYVQQAGRQLSDVEIGRLYSDAIEVALKQHSKVGGEMFVHLDEVIAASKEYTDKVFTRVDKSSILDPSGKHFQTVHHTTKPIEILPVSTKELKIWAEKELKQIEGVEGLVESWRYKYLKKILDPNNLGDHISFKAAQSLRSEWFELSRRTTDAFSSADKGATQQLIIKIDEAMTQTAAEIGGDFYQQFRHANKFWKTGKERMANEFMSQILKLNPERIGEEIFATGNVAQIRKARHALKSAAFFTKGKEGALDFNKTWKKMQQGYLNHIMGGARRTSATELTEGATKISGSEIASGQMQLSELKKLFTDPKLMRTFEHAFTKEQRIAIKRLMSSIEAAQKLPKGTGTFMVTVTQGSLVIGAMSGGYLAGGVGGAAVGVGVYTIAASQLSKALTNPKFVTLLATGLHMKPTHREYAATLAKIVNYASELAGYQITPQIEDF